MKLEHVERSTPSKRSTSLSIQITKGLRDDATAVISGSLGQAASTSSLPSRGGELERRLHHCQVAVVSKLERRLHHCQVAVVSEPERRPLQC